MKNNFTSFGLVILRKQREDCLSSINHMCYYYSSCSNQGRNNLGTPSRRGKECSLCCTGQWPNQAGSVSQPYQVSHPFSGEAQARRDPFATSSTYTNSKVLLNDLIMCSQHKERALWEQHLPWMVLVLEVNIWDQLLFLLPRGKKKPLFPSTALPRIPISSHLSGPQIWASKSNHCSAAHELSASSF